MPINARILIDLQAALAEGQQDFSLLCTYKGVPIDRQVVLLRLEGERLWVTVAPPGPVFYLRQRQALLLSQGMLDPLACEVAEADPAQRTACLTGLDFAGRHFANRHELRVEPAAPLALVLRGGGRELRLEAADVSMNGLGAFCPTAQTGAEFASGQPVQAHLELPGGAVELAGVVRRLDASEGGCRLALAFSGAEPQRVQLLHYVMRRRAEITAEVAAFRA